MVSSTYLDAFVPEGCDDSQCVDCGICLQECPVMEMDSDEAIQEMRRLLSGEKTERVLKECTFCYSCNTYCPHGLKPYNLIMERMVAENRESGGEIPDAMNYMFTGKNDSGFFFDQYNAAPDENKTILEKWAKVPPKAQDTLFIGCYGRTVPYGLEHSTVLKDLPKYGPKDACCGEIPHRFGDYEYFAKLVEKTHKQLSSLETERLVCYCGSCANYLGNIWPNYHGVKLPFKIISLYEWLWEKLQAGKLSIQQTWEKDMVVSDSCYASELGDPFFDAVRGLQKAAGMKLVELENNRNNTLCCGFACGIRNNYDQSQVAIQSGKKIDQIVATDVKNVSVNCPGCWANLVQAGKGTDLKVSFAINEILKAFGDDPLPRR